MIVFNLGCENNHRFEGWFGSADDFEQQRQSKQVACPMCGNDNVVRLPHASHIKGTARPPAGRVPADSAGQDERQYANVGREFLARLIERIIENTEDVGSAFPEEARKIHYREAPERQIRGTASREEVEELADEGIEVVALPIPASRTGRSH